MRENNNNKVISKDKITTFSHLNSSECFFTSTGGDTHTFSSSQLIDELQFY